MRLARLVNHTMVLVQNEATLSGTDSGGPWAHPKEAQMRSISSLANCNPAGSTTLRFLSEHQVRQARRHSDRIQWNDAVSLHEGRAQREQLLRPVCSKLAAAAGDVRIADGTGWPFRQAWRHCSKGWQSAGHLQWHAIVVLCQGPEARGHHRPERRQRLVRDLRTRVAATA